MSAGKVNGWWVVAAAAIPITLDLMVEPYILGPFVFFCVVFGIIVVAAWSILKDEIK